MEITILSRHSAFHVVDVFPLPPPDSQFCITWCFVALSLRSACFHAADEKKYDRIVAI